MFKKKLKRTKDEVAKIIQDFLDERGGGWDWDDFISIPIEDDYLEKIRLRCADLDHEFPPSVKGHFCNDDGIEVLREYVSALKNTKSGE